MTLYPNLPCTQTRTQQIVDEFNRDEEEWRRSLLRRLKQRSRRELAATVRKILKRQEEGKSHQATPGVA